MKTFVSYRHTGENPTELRNILTVVQEALRSVGVEAYCTFFDEPAFKREGYGAREILDHAFSEIDTCDFLLVIQTSEAKSEGMLMEVGYCIAKHIPIVVATKLGVELTYVPKMATAVLTWVDVDDLGERLRSFNFAGELG